MVNRYLRLYLTMMLLALPLAYGEHRLGLPTTTPQSFPIVTYQHAFGSLDGRSCPSYPVCSAYTRQAFQTHGVLLASWLMLDRLIHEADDGRQAHTIVIDGIVRNDDRLQRNDFWLPKKRLPF